MKPVLLNAYFDSETLGLNPYVPNAKIVLAQLRYNGDNYLIKEWEHGEKGLIKELQELFESLPQYTPVITYNGGFDFNYLIGRINCLDFDILTKIAMHDAFIRHIKHCDLLQFDGGYFVALFKIARKYGFPLQSKYDGSHIEGLYKHKNYDEIIEHGVEDIEVLEKLVESTDLANRFLRNEILSWTERKWKR
jgi:uncharacterized protein YprB with RNaseH-like and TPR domain